MASFWFYTFPKSQWTPIPEVTASFQDQTIVVTGSNGGLGFEAARQVAALGAAKVVLACRSVEKGEAAAAELLALLDGKVNRNVFEVWQLDISSYKSIKAFTTRLNTLDRLDAVIQNAGIITNAFKLLDESGEESVLTTDLTGPILFGLSILPKLRESASRTGSRGRLAYVGSDLHYAAQFKEVEAEGSLFDALNDPKKANMFDRYPTTKLLLSMTVGEIAARSPISEKSNVIITCMTPGLCKSNLNRDSPLPMKIMMAGMTAVFARSTEVGGRTLVHAVNPDLSPDVHGKFLMDCELGAYPPKAEGDTGRALQKRFVDELFPKLEKIQSGVTACLAV